MRTNKRPLSPYWLGPGASVVLSGTGGDGLARLLPHRAAPGPYGPPRAAGRAWPRDGPRWRRKRGGYTAALRAAGGSRRFPRTRPKPAEAPAPPVAAGTRTQRPEATATALPAATAAAAAALGGSGAAAIRRPERLRSAASGAVRVRRGQFARLVQCAAGQAHVSKGE